MKYKTLRHITSKKKLSSIIENGELSSEYLNEIKDRRYVSIESNPKNDTLFKVFYYIEK